jgi:uncharacterized protein YjgD (DUF1641 family)
MHNYTDKELIKELLSRGYETFNPKEYAIEENMWTLDDAIDTYNHIRKVYNVEDYLTHEQLMRILNDTLSSEVVMSTISELLYEKIYEHLIED